MPLSTNSRGWLSLSSLVWTAALFVLFLQLVMYLAHAASILAYPFDLDQGEGYDVNAGWLLLQGRPIYTDNESYPYYSSNYPPIYSLFVAGAVAVLGPQLLAGRVVSLLATLGIGLLLFQAARSRGGAVGGAVAAGVFWMSNYVYHVTPLARVNALTAFFALAGLLCVGRNDRRWVAAGGFFLLAALFTKPTAIDAAGAAALSLLIARPRRGVLFGLVLGLAGLLLLMLLDAATDRAFSLNVFLGNVNPFVPGQLEAYFLNFALLHAVPLGLALYAAGRAFARRAADPFDLFLVTGLIAALGVGKWGAGESYFLSAIVASSVVAGRAAGELSRRGGAGASLMAILLVVQAAVSAHGLVSTRISWLPDRGLQAAALAPEPTIVDLERGHGIVTRLREVGGVALVEDPGFELAAGKEIVGNATHLRNLHQAGLWKGDNLVTEIQARRYHTVVLDAELYPEPVLAAIGRYYFLYDSVHVHRANQKVFLPGRS